jgi:hypothetical protein
MRFKSKLTNGYQVFAVSGVNTISFAIDAVGANTAGLLGFAVERLDPTGRQYPVRLKFQSFVIPRPTPHGRERTFDHPVQACVG